MSKQSEKNCVIVGVGPGNGVAFAKKFVKEKYAVHYFLKADDIADTVFNLTQQRQSAWTFELDLRPFGEKW